MNQPVLTFMCHCLQKTVFVSTDQFSQFVTLDNGSVLKIFIHCCANLRLKGETNITTSQGNMNSEVDLIKEPVSFPRLTSQINGDLAREFVGARYLGLFWCEDLCAQPQEEVEGVGIWVRYPRNARQAVGIDLPTADIMADLVGRSTLTLHNMCR
jgi:hypothetical protein